MPLILILHFILCYISSLPLCRFLNSPSVPATIVRCHSLFNRQIAGRETIDECNMMSIYFHQLAIHVAGAAFLYPYGGYVASLDAFGMDCV